MEISDTYNPVTLSLSYRVFTHLQAAEADMLHDSPINLLTEVLANNCLFTQEATSAAGCLSPYSKCPISISFLPWLSLTYVPVDAAGAAQSYVFLTVCQVWSFRFLDRPNHAKP